MNVLVVGGCGYVGGAVVDLLLRSDHSVRVYDVLLYEECYRKPVDFVFGDIRDRAWLRPQLEWADAVVWLAALVGDGACALDHDCTMAINQESVEWLSRSFGGRIVFMSTCSVYGAQEGLLDEGSPVAPLSLYAKTKLAAEAYLHDRDALIFRLGTLFGVGDAFSRIRLDLVVNTMTARAHHHGVITVVGGEQYRPLLHVRDVARAVVENLTTTTTGVFNLHESNQRILDIACRVGDQFPGVRIEQKPMPPQDRRDYRVSSEKARRLLNFDPRHGVEEGVAQLKALLSDCRVRDWESPRYRNEAFLAASRAHLLVPVEASRRQEAWTTLQLADRYAAA